ncbi:MAG: choice-of-anchor L domain-containing protein, partial [Mameliella sp.]|nr:choice-of-anchor L domain-containing protein [Phaeodactylibacter sp.]
DTSYTATEMVNAFFSDSDVAAFNVTHTGDPASMAFFDAGDTYLGINAGIFLSTGPATSAANPAYYDATHTPLIQPGDADLESLLEEGMLTHDASILEFDIVPSTDTICFNYIFGSEEYPEFVGSTFNDVFAFFITGGPEYDSMTNIAVIPDSDPVLPVAINNLNADSYSSFYIPQFTVDTLFNGVAEYDTSATDLAYDAYTTLLPAKAYVTPGETYHIKIGITDVGDGIFDSGVFIGITSLGGDSLLTPTADANISVINDQLIVENVSSFAKAFEWDFGDGPLSNDRHPEPHTYMEAGEYTVQLTAHTWCCSATFTQTVMITEPLAANFGVTPQAGNCPGDAFDFEDLSEGAVSSWAWHFPGGEPVASNEPNPTVVYTASGLYDVTLTVTDIFGQTEVLMLTDAIEIQPLPTAAFEPVVNELQVTFQNNAENATSYLWDFGDDNQSAEQSPVHNYAVGGNYTVSLTAMNDCGEAIATSTVDVVVVSTQELSPSDFALFPNPVSDQLTVRPATSGTYDLAIYRTDGQLLRRLTGLQGQHRIATGDWSAGIYVIEVTNAKGALQQLINKH